MIHERAAFQYALSSVDLLLYPKRIFLTFFPPRNRMFDRDSIEYLDENIENYSKAIVHQPSEDAFRLVLLQDADKVRNFFTKTFDLLNFDAPAIIEKCYEWAELYLAERLKLPWRKLNYNIYEHYPPPMEWQDTYAFTALHAVSEHIQPGVYYKLDHLFPKLAEIATLHENVHIATLSSGFYSFFDNGIADFLAFIVFFHHEKSMDAIRTYRCYLNEVSPCLIEYPHYSNMIGSLFQQVGFRGLYSLIWTRLQNPAAIDWQLLFRKCQQASIHEEDIPEVDEPIVSHWLDDLEVSAKIVVASMIFPSMILMISPLAYRAISELNEQGPLTLEMLQKQLLLDSGIVHRLVEGELTDLRLVQNVGVNMEEQVYSRPLERFAVSETAKLIATLPIRVSIPIDFVDRAMIGLLSDTHVTNDYHTYALATAKRGKMIPL